MGATAASGWRRQGRANRLTLQDEDTTRQGMREVAVGELTYTALAKMIDHSLLQPNLTDADLERGCRLAREYDVASVCIKPYAVRLAVRFLAGSSVTVGTTVGFPHGGHVTRIKVAEAEQALSDGARELDMVVNIGKVLSSDWRYVADDILA